MPANTFNTTSDNGRNIRPELKPESYFFLEPGKNFTQADTEKFGIVSNGTNASVFRTTSQISGYSGKIYTICKGQIFVQPNSSSLDKVNIILKPFVQPINGLAIKYIIYRGLNKQDFFANGEVKPDDGSDATEFVKHIRAEFKALFQMLKIKPEPQFLADYIGYQQDNLGIPVEQEQKSEDLIDTYFFKTSETEDNIESVKTAFELPVIPEGICLGEISDETLGIDIILNEGDYTIENDPNPFQLNLSYARASDYYLNKSGYSGLQEKLIKESAASFIDIAAFYGLHAQGNGKIHLKPSNETLQNADDIYNLIKNFKTKNTVYLYIQSNRQRSYNFYGNYDLNGNNIRIGVTEDNLYEKKFGSDGWPVEIFENTYHSETLLLSLINNKNYFDKIFYVDIGNLQDENKDVLFIKDFKNLSDKEKDYLEAVNFRINKVANIVRLLYVGDNINEPYLTTEPYFLDKYHNVIRELYPLINVKTPIDLEGNLKSISFNKKSFVNLDSFSNLQSLSVINNSIIFYNGKKQEGEDFSYKEKVLFLAKKAETIDSNETNNRDLIFGTRTTLTTNIPKDNESQFLMLKIYGEANYKYFYNQVNDSGTVIKLLKLKLNETLDTTFFTVGITKEEYEKLLAIIPIDVSNVKLYIDEEEKNPLLDIDAKKSYFKSSLGIGFENNIGYLQILFPSDKIYIYGDSIYSFVSREFVEYEHNITLEKEQRWTTIV